ncbi:DUF3000 domain-containing protein [Corynebacterium aquatimens]|uniref:DUF3000 domain-containing protein n=1 Tax=Corynebacterium aquatimens TaxID=1190508 RepID=A0A931DZ71_9CORY|nr:hypothetical protein [Corynebacterium aquatimens]
MTHSDSPHLAAAPTASDSSHVAPTAVDSPTGESALPEEFTAAVESMHAARLRPEITLGTIRPPQRPAPFSHAVGLEVALHDEDAPIPTDSEGDAFGRLILLYSPSTEEAWEGSMRLVAYIQADMDDAVASDPFLPDVAWQWLNESLDNTGATYTNLGGTVTSTASVRFGEIGGPPRAYQIEMRASWTAAGTDLSHHVEAFSQVLAYVAGLPPEGVTGIDQRQR